VVRPFAGGPDRSIPARSALTVLGMRTDCNHVLKAAARSGSRAEVLFLGEARLGGVAAVCDAPEGVFDRKRIECIGIVVTRPFFEMGMARMSRVGDRFEQFVEARDAAAVLGRSIPFATDVARIFLHGIAKDATMLATRTERTIVVGRKHVGKKLTGGDGIGLSFHLKIIWS
jgi:hypothetical protein